MSIYNFTVKNIENNDISLSDYKGKLILIVNTATGCGFTPQYEGLQALYEKYNSKGFEVLDFPCNQFGKQAPGSGKEIQSFCQLNYNVSFPQFAKVDVNGSDASPLFKYLKSKKKGMLGSKIKWNFTKFLVDREGNVIERFAPTADAEKIEEVLLRYI